MSVVGGCCHSLPHMALKPKVARIYLNQEAQEMLRVAVGQVQDLSESQLLGFLVSAGLRALRDNGYTLTHPVRLAMVSPDVEIPIPSSRL